MPTTKRPRPPTNLGRAGARLWRETVAVYELRGDELLLLDKASRTADDAERLDVALAEAPLLVPGSAGQDRPNPLLGEARATRALLAALLRQLALPDPVAEQRRADARSSQARTAARARWS